jgi:hypothetical protein
MAFADGRAYDPSDPGLFSDHCSRIDAVHPHSPCESILCALRESNNDGMASRTAINRRRAYERRNGRPQDDNRIQRVPID